MTAQEDCNTLITVNGIPAAEGLVALARAVLEFDRLNRAYYESRPGGLTRSRLREVQGALDRAYRSMVAKASIVEPKRLDTKG